MVSNRSLVWDLEASNDLKLIYNFLVSENNREYALKVKDTILRSVKELLENPHIYEQDRFKFENNGSYRAFEKLNYRVAFKITENQIRILRIRHTSREPVGY